MVYFAVNKNGDETIHNEKPFRYEGRWLGGDRHVYSIYLPKGTIYKILGYELTWGNKPVEYGG